MTTSLSTTVDIVFSKFQNTFGGFVRQRSDELTFKSFGSAVQPFFDVCINDMTEYFAFLLLAWNVLNFQLAKATYEGYHLLHSFKRKIEKATTKLNTKIEYANFMGKKVEFEVESRLYICY